ncbi:hypothetical protein KQI38_18990 [Tissierella carlieri]|uniref:Transglutaminase-like domain-containing protein n=1 Tax=Tissierella carlieri TaxID=689904 RepID=A0ABT1S617_9FIRM|nr:transglutaminase domain-containing protein [Tissierella carlieri]MBU5314109.1 hypothetical protein [Tissierella carlieri]MCQ4921910.1 hypothetical protein [Tissierella carlieri]
MRKKLIKIFLVEIIIIIIAFVYFFSRYNMYDTSLQGSLRVNTDENPVEVNKRSKLYLELEKGLLEGKERIDIKSMALFKDPKEIFNVLEEISNENPEIMYYKAAEYQFGNLSLFYSKSKEDINNHQKEIRKIREAFISNYILPEMSDYEKILTIHDYIINNSKYDDKLFISGVVPPESYSSYGILALGRGVCEGYAKSMKYLLDGIGIESMIVIGESKGENHAWNLVKIEDEYYHVDTTWDDPVTSDGSDIIRYNFFNLNDDEISKSHTWNKEDYPSANGEKYNYFKYNNFIVNGKDELKDQIKNILLKRKSHLLIKINNFNNEDILLNEIIENAVYENYKLISLKSYSYSVDEEYGIVSFEFYY